MEIFDPNGDLVASDSPAIEGLTHETLPTIKQGRYDQEIEIYVDGRVVYGLVSRLRVGQKFRFLDRVNRDPNEPWYTIVEPVQTMGRFDPNPTFIIKSLAIAQAPPMDSWLPRSRVRALAAPAPAPTKSKPVLEFEDVQDKNVKD